MQRGKSTRVRRSNGSHQIKEGIDRAVRKVHFAIVIDADFGQP